MKQEFTVTVYTENQIGLLNRIAIMFSRRKINIESLNTSPSEIEGIHRFTIVINEVEEVVKKLARQIEKQVEVLKAYYNTNDEIVWQELALYKVPTDEIAEKVKVAVKNSTNWADFVFAPGYKLKSLSEVEMFINANRHLPGVPSAENLVKEGGIDVNEMFAKQMEKIEELTLYMIELKKEIETLKKDNAELKSPVTITKQ